MRSWAQSRDGSGELAIDVERSSGAYAIVLRGALDLSTADAFDAAVDAALDSDARRVSIDLDGLEFVDSTGLAAILRATRRDTEARLRMSRGTGEVAELFRLTALDLVLPFD